ncbi:hypothetical protein K435DRAFT_853504 [Dendrothele bispora CBS 962.96]|uniref:Uncharacterized protein n=1 Tax=Dendrothele bispora (strain CBS 962.96) TaxID=1314807 RepID=A0A4S8MHM3_DENBC|nr:hypothetical protein K435DRAFT_853504 [Dendrothele bispora CBS 962.96]
MKAHRVTCLQYDEYSIQSRMRKVLCERMESDGRRLAGVTVTKAFPRERRCICIDSAKLAGTSVEHPSFALLRSERFTTNFRSHDLYQFPKRRCICIDSAKLAANPYPRRPTTSTSIPDPRRLYPQRHPSIALTQRLRGQTTCRIESRLKEEERARKEWEGQVHPHLVIVIVVTALFIPILSRIPSSSTQPLQRCHEEAEDVSSKDILASMHGTLFPPDCGLKLNT